MFYRQERIGKDGVPFRLFKFRTMRVDSDKAGLLTVGMNDARITPIGGFLRKLKL
ncbi:MAG: lipopolysaccharide/colanic/teichoic acid biosynthesis glycosyltransferase, partial [Crocinitomicaceae bacterium]